ncbi:ketopantoate reductase family protein [Bacillus sp. 03113]|uniref:ketopantoate reductase family protein n=1 Tax=Bacillus sp. 03113 TaxID=2578211 RepID=UPI001143F91E|nr:2-dehydropantoate 2-reductase [Bacillus sp. 03113]
MREIKTISLIGLGAIGCAYGSKLFDLDPHLLQVIANDDRIKKYKENPILVNGKRYDFPFTRPDEKKEPADLIIVSVKAIQLSKAIQDMKHHVGKNTIILSLLNGITSEDEIGKVFGKDKLLYSMCVGIDANRIENHTHFTSSGTIVFGEKQNNIYSDRVHAVKILFDQAGINYEIPKDMMHSLWWKFMVNVGINQCSAVLRGRYGVFQTIDEAKKLMEETMWEVIHVANKIGVQLSGEDINSWYHVLNKLNPASRTSMLEDIELGRKTEVDIFAGVICELGKKYGVDTPVNQMLYYMIKTNEAMSDTRKAQKKSTLLK